MTTPTVTSRTGLAADVWEALGRVYDPELDQPVTELGFVRALVVQDGRVQVRLRLPTYFCAPNFAYLMVSDAHDVVKELPGVTEVDVALEDHFAAEEINAGVAAGDGFPASFPGEATGGLDDLRMTFLRKAHTASLEGAAKRLVAAGWSPESLDRARLADMPESPERRSLLRRRDAIGLSLAPEAPLFVDDDGRPIDREALPLRLRFARTVRVTIDANTTVCRGLLETRYGTVDRTPMT
ncbi:iron-sulfur cluster assembly protein [Frankia sp. B2]|uniref:iron-sulfur cluster assembly protein n=1 Tax=Frankia sp. B2 TaxID=2541730 RepID=UPI00106948D4|nr:iron-sulfur cluster assembly protein [Frankia sp. B2]TFE24594.1 iron-sulfur cluster assembly protein [Frankia sp. B2]